MTVDEIGCIGNTIKVASGYYVDLANPDPATIDIDTIAAALGKMCRFGCHCPRFYSVAEHSIHAMYLACKQGLVGDALRAVLLHDAAEAYIGDVVKPLKVMLPDYRVVEERMERAVSARLGIDFDLWESQIKRFDLQMLKAEKMELWPDDNHEWTGFDKIETVDVPFQYWSPEIAESKFLGAAESLGLL